MEINKKESVKDLIIKSIENQESNIERVLGGKVFEELLDFGNYLSIPHKAKSEKFHDEYVLNDSDYPLPDNKFYQSITEGSARLQNLIIKIKDYKDLILDIENLEIEIELLSIDISKKNVKASSPYCREKISILERKQIEIKQEKMKNELTQKQFSVGFIISDIQEVYGEFIGWKNLVKKYSSQIKLDSFGKSREAAMEIKKEILRATVRPEDAKGGEIPLVIEWSELNKEIIKKSESELLIPFAKDLKELTE